MIPSSQRSQPTSLRSSIDYKQRNGNNDQKSRRSSFVENLILQYKTQSNKKSMNTNINQSARYYDHQQQQQYLSHQKTSSRSKQVENFLFMKENNNMSITQVNKKDNQLSVQRKLFSNIINNNNHNTQKNSINFPSSSTHDDFEMNFLQKYKSTEIQRKDTYNLSNNNNNNNSNNNNNNRNAFNNTLTTTSEPNINRTSYNKDIKAKTTNMLMTNKNNNNNRQCLFQPQQQYSSQILRNIMFSNNINTISRERFVKKGAGGVMINNGNNNNGNNINRINKTTKATNYQKSTQKQQQQNNNITINSNINKKLNQFSNHFYYNFNHCINMLLVQQKQQRTQQGLDLLLNMKKGLKQFVDECCGNNNKYNNNIINNNIHGKQMNDNQSTMITTQIQMMEFMCLSLYQLFVTRKYDQHQQRQNKQQQHQLKLQQKLQSKYTQLTKKLSLSANNINILTITKQINKCHAVVKLNRLNNLLLLSLSKKSITLSNSSSNNKNTVDDNKNNKQQSPIVVNIIDQKINKLIRQIKQLLLQQQNNNNNNFDNGNSVSSSRSLLSTIIKLIEQQQLFTISTTIHNDHIDNNNINNNINNHTKQNTLDRLTILSQRLLQFNHQLMFFIKQFAHQFDKNNQQFKSNNNTNRQHLTANEQNHVTTYHHDGLLQMLFIKVINQSQTIMFNHVRKQLLSLLLSSYSQNKSDDLSLLLLLLLSEIDHKQNLVELNKAVKWALYRDQQQQQQQSLLLSSLLSKTKHIINKPKCNQPFLSQQQSLTQQLLLYKCKVQIQKLVIFKIVIKILQHKHKHKDVDKHQDDKGTTIKQLLLNELSNEFKRLFYNNCYSHKSRSSCSQLIINDNNSNIRQQQQQLPKRVSKQQQQQQFSLITTQTALQYPKLFIIWYQLMQLTNRYQSFYLVNMLQQMSTYTMGRINKMDKLDKVNNPTKHQQHNYYPSHHHCRQQHMYKLRQLMKWLQQKLLIIYYELGQLGKCYSYLSKVIIDDGEIDCIDSKFNNINTNSEADTNDPTSLQSWHNLITTTPTYNNSKKGIYQLFILWKLCLIKGQQQQQLQQLQQQQQQLFYQQQQSLSNQKQLKQLTIILLYQLVYQLGQQYKNTNNNHHFLKYFLIQKVFGNLFEQYDDKNMMGDDKEQEQEQQQQQQQLYKSLTIRTSQIKVLMLLVYFQIQLIKTKTAYYSLDDNNNINDINNNNNIINPSPSSSIIMNTFQNDDDDSYSDNIYHNINNQSSSSSSYHYYKPQHNNNNYKQSQQQQQQPIMMRKLKQLLLNNNNKYNKPIQYHTKSINSNVKLLSTKLQKNDQQINTNNKTKEQSNKMKKSQLNNYERIMLLNIFHNIKYDNEVFLNSNR